MGNLRLGSDTWKEEQLFDLTFISPHDSQVTFNLLNAFLNFSLNIRNFGYLGLSRAKHGFDRSGALPLAETLHGLLGYAHFFSETVCLLEKELRGRFGGVRTPLENIADILVAVGVRELHRKIRVRRGDHQIDETGIGAINRRRHGTQCRRYTVRRCVAGWDSCSCEKAGVLIELQPRGNTLRKGVTAKQINHCIDHVDTTNLLITHLLHFGIQNAGLVLLDEQHRTSTVFCFDFGKIDSRINASQNNTEDDDPKPVYNGMKILAPINSLLNRSETGSVWCFGVYFLAHPK